MTKNEELGEFLKFKIEYEIKQFMYSSKYKKVYKDRLKIAIDILLEQLIETSNILLKNATEEEYLIFIAEVLAKFNCSIRYKANNINLEDENEKNIQP